MTEGTPIKQDVRKCRGCKEPIIFVQVATPITTDKPKWIRLNAKPERRMIINADHKAESVTVWTPHKGTCNG